MHWEHSEEGAAPRRVTERSAPTWRTASAHRVFEQAWQPNASMRTSMRVPKSSSMRPGWKPSLATAHRETETSCGKRSLLKHGLF